jgi:uncharacterized protein YjbI with pentapeptide repeats
MADMRWADWSKVDLQDAKLNNTNLYRSNMDQVNLTSANLIRANLPTPYIKMKMYLRGLMLKQAKSFSPQKLLNNSTKSF